MPMLAETIEKTFALDFNLDVIAEDAYKDHILIMNFLEKRDAEGIKSAVTIHLHHAFLTEQLHWQSITDLFTDFLVKRFLFSEKFQ